LVTDLTDILTSAFILRPVLILFHHQLPSRIGDKCRLDKHSHRYICHLSSPTISPWRQTWQTFSRMHLFSSKF
jgi:hypothetical protein